MEVELGSRLDSGIPLDHEISYVTLHLNFPTKIPPGYLAMFEYFGNTGSPIRSEEVYIFSLHFPQYISLVALIAAHYSWSLVFVG
jgi:hypothetical protein